MRSELKYQILANTLRDHILDGVYTEGEMLETENELAEKYGVSRRTVREALGILEKEGFIDRRRGSGTYVRQNKLPREKTMMIGVVVTYVSQYIFPAIISGIETELIKNGYTMKMSSTLNQVENERNILIDCLNKPVDGLIIQATKTNLRNPNIPLYKELSKKGIPYIFLNAYTPELKDAPYVVTDYYSGGKQAIHYLVKKGHRNIAGIFGMSDYQSVERYKGYMDGLIERGLGIFSKRVSWYVDTSKDVSFEGEFGVGFLDALDGCTALFCHNDLIAIKAIEFLEKKGMKVPDDIAVIGCDNSIYGELNKIKVTTLNNPIDEMARIATKQIVDMINGEPGQQIVLPMALIEKEST